MKTNTTPPYAKTLHMAISALAPRAVAIYGLGVVARDVCQILADINVVGLMDKDPANNAKAMYGTTVLSDADVLEKRVDTIVIAASEVYWEVIAARIETLCRTAGIRVLFLDGRLAYGEDDCSSTPELAIGSREMLDKAIATSDVVSFDLFETLVSRFASRPDDILELAIGRAEQELVTGEDLVSLRKEAEAHCRVAHGQYCFDLESIYGWMARHSNLAGSAITCINDCEVSTEVALSVPRPSVVEIYRKCLSAAKLVCITTDTHLSRASICRILAHCGIPEPAEMFISCEAGGSKASGKLFETVKKSHPNHRIVHIGDHPDSDGTSAHAHGMQTFRIPSCGYMLVNSRLRSVLVHARTSHDGILLGMIGRELFESPFTPLDQPVLIADLRKFGYIFFGPVVLAWMVWLTSQLRRNPTNRLLFLAREGYLLTPLYNRLRTAYQLDDLPEGLYFPTSRRMAAVASLRNREDARALLDDEFSGTARQLLESRYGITDKHVDDRRVISNKDSEAALLVDAHMESILANAAEERSCYLSYMAGLGITPEVNITLADLGIKGTIQHSLQRILGSEMLGCYITGFFGLTNPYGMTGNTAALFANSSSGENSYIFRYHLLWESILVAPHGMFLRVSSDGTLATAPMQKNQRLFEQKSEVHAGMEDFLSDWIQTGVALESTRLTPELIDNLFGRCMSRAVTIHDAIKSILYVDESYRNQSEKRVFD